MSDLHRRMLMSGMSGSALPPKMPRPMGGGGRGGGKTGLRKSRDYSALPWSDYFDAKETVNTESGAFNVYLKGDRKDTSAPLVVMLHGGGFSGLTWSLPASMLVKRVRCRVASIDLRGHGETEATDEEDLSAETMASDVCAVVKSLFPEGGSDVILVGHSMGGALAVHAALRGEIGGLAGVVVVDVVEGEFA